MSTPYCKPCLDKGHQCLAIDVIWKPDEIPMCAFCEDNVPCPVMKRAADPSMRDRPQHKPTLAGDKFKVGKDRSRPQKVDDKPFVKEIEMPEKICGRTGCGKRLRATNSSGYCSKHFYDSKRKSAAPAAGGGKLSAKTRRNPSKRSPVVRPAPKGNGGNGNGHGALASLVVSEAQIDAMFTAWPLEDKTTCIQMFLDRGTIA